LVAAASAGVRGHVLMGDQPGVGAAVFGLDLQVADPTLWGPRWFPPGAAVLPGADAGPVRRRQPLEHLRHRPRTAHLPVLAVVPRRSDGSFDALRKEHAMWRELVERVC